MYSSLWPSESHPILGYKSEYIGYTIVNVTKKGQEIPASFARQLPRCQFIRAMYASRLRRVGLATTHHHHHHHHHKRGQRCPEVPRPPSISALSRHHSNGSVRTSPKDTSGVSKVAGIAVETGEAVLRTARQQLEAVKTGQTRFAMPSASSIAGAVAMVPVVGGMGFATVYAFRHRLCENTLQQVSLDIFPCPQNPRVPALPRC